MGYADLAAARAELNISENAASDATKRAMLVAFDAALTLRFDELTGRRWGAFAAEQRVVEAPATAVSNLLILPHPLTAVTAVEDGGTWNGTTWTGGTAVAATYLRLVYGGHGLLRSDGGYWSGPVRITGAWGDETNASPPTDVVAALTEAVVAEYRHRTFNARAATSGFDEVEAQRPTRPESGPLWRAAVKTHALHRLVVA